MWSDRYCYLNIYKHCDLSETMNSDRIRDFLCSIPELQAKSGSVYINKLGVEFMEMILLKASSLDSWSEKDISIDETNLITIVCAKNASENLRAVFPKIANFLHWQLVEE